MPDLILQAMSAKERGDIALAKQLLSQALIQDPTNEAAWMLMADVVEDVKLRRNCLERVLAINPDNKAASSALSRLNTSPLSPISRGERDKPIDPQKFEKIAPYTPPFTWENEQQQKLTEASLTYTEVPAEPGQPEPEETPTFDWASESAEPDKTIQRIFDAVSNPELASQPLPDSDLSWIEDEQQNGQILQKPEDLSEDDLMLSEAEDPAPEPVLNQAPPSMDDFKVSAEPQLGLNAFLSSDQPIQGTTPDYLLWDNPRLRTNRLVILSSKSLIVASPKATDIPHIKGLFNENKMLRDLLGKQTGMIRLEDIQRLSSNPKTARVRVDYSQDKTPTRMDLKFVNRRVRDEFLAAITLRLGANYKQATHSFGVGKKIILPLIILLIVLFIGWSLIAGLSLLSQVPTFQTAPLQAYLAYVLYYTSRLDPFKVVLFTTLFALLVLIWLTNNLGKPSKLIVIKHV